MSSEMSKQPKLRPKSHIEGYPDGIYDFSTPSTLSQHGSHMALSEDKPDQRVFRVKRKHVLKACDRCRVKKTKCDGKQPCNRCSSYNHPCLFRERKATQAKVYSRGFVEMLESHHSLVVKALQRLYNLCATKEGFPGEPLAEASDGYPLTHAILDRLGLIKQAEDSSKNGNQDNSDLQYLRVLSNSTDCCATADPSPEPATPPDPAPNISSPVQLSPGDAAPVKWEYPSVQSEPYSGYPHAEFRGNTLSRPIHEPVTNPGDVKCSAPIHPPVTGLANAYMYYSENNCGTDSTDSGLPPIVTTSGGLPAVTAAGLPAGLVGNYSIHIPEQTVYHPPLATAWAYPCE
ncbi:hypothetical protein BJY01DRAFT_198432 [Aspergillus pseudoustus]|uniref:Zn(2)-C6 fungal-type domain-containing protein n=1 Tax=Aspergillus pseudoustus TaxID=1810923 RepID=A0ABR4JSX3_9EURO